MTTKEKLLQADLRNLRIAKQEESNQPTVSLSEVKQLLSLDKEKGKRKK